MTRNFLILSLGLLSVSMGCTEKTTDTSEPSGEPAGEPGQEPGQEPAGEPNNPPVEDEDGDGFTRDDGDCDDNNPDVYPGAEDIPGNGIDEDCSGTDAQDNGRILDDVFTGELIVTEVMNNPSAVGDDVGEWIEIFNNSDSAINLEGLVVSDASDDAFTIDEVITLPSREHIVLGLSMDSSVNGGVGVNFAYTGFILSNSADEVYLSYNGTIIDEMIYSAEAGYGLLPGKSLSLHVDKYDFNDNDLSDSWCPSPSSFQSLGDYGTPGQMNPFCPSIEDVDGDGFNTLSDCNDNDEDINPVAEEIWYDGIDQNCNGDSDYDQDGDGFDSDQHSGQDCDDTNELINPTAYDVPQNGTDENCDGNDAAESSTPTVLDLSAGDLVISEVMYNPAVVSDADGEWFEIYVMYGGEVDLGGLAICDNQNCTAITSSLIVQSGSYVVVGTNSDSATNGGVNIDFEYSGLNGLSNSGDVITLSYGSTVIDTLDYLIGFPNLNGASMNLKPGNITAMLNDESFNWCASTSTYGAGDAGTPGAENDSCD